MVTSPPCATAARTADTVAATFTNAAKKQARAPWVAASAMVPLVVVYSSVRPSTDSGVYSAGEFPKSNPSIFSIRRSPAS